MARPLTSAQRHENAAFLKALRRTGNARLAARECGLKYGTMQYRRAKHPALAQRWDAAIVLADARLRQAGGRHGPGARAITGINPVTSKLGVAELGRPPAVSQTATLPACGYRTAGGEPVVVMLKSGKLQLRRAQPGKVTRQAEQAFLLAVAATANIALAAASVGVAEAAFHRRKRQNPAFARELRAALTEGYERLEGALLESWSPASGDDAAWRHNDPPALPRMTPAEALQLMHLHHKQVRWREAELGDRLLPGETSDRRSAKMARLYRARLTEDAEAVVARDLDEAVARIERLAPPPIVLPDLSQVTGWSKADPAKGGHGKEAMFGGWRVENLSEAQRAAGRAKGQAARRGRVLKGRGE